MSELEQDENRLLKESPSTFEVSPEDLAILLQTLSDGEIQDLMEEVRIFERTIRENNLDDWFPDTGPLRYQAYHKHFKFWEYGATEPHRAFIAANRVGKTVTGGFECTQHLIGLYRPWWPGRRFTESVDMWICGDTHETIAEIIQPLLFGKHGEMGQGLIPNRFIKDISWRRGRNDTIESAIIEHASGNDSRLLFKSYEAGRKSFQGTHMQVIWLDEEPSMDIFAECLLRLMATRPDGVNWGNLMCTFTPLLGMSDVCLHFLPGGRMPDVAERRQ